MRLLPTDTVNDRRSQSSLPDLGSSVQIGTRDSGAIKVGATESIVRTAIAMSLTISVISSASIADVEMYHEETQLDARHLSTSEILETFSNALDRGEVQNGKGISAETLWLSSGHFETRWWRETAEAPKINVVSGRWKVENNQRCVLFAGASQGEWQCTPVFQRADGAIISLNGDGSLHGIHKIIPLDLSGEDPH
jgi:hypothetical protein